MPKAYGIIGFVKFLKGYYLVLIADRKKVAKIGKHSIFKIKEMKMITLFKSVIDKREDEAKYVQIFKEIDISKGFYFSYTYDITHTLQGNVLKQLLK